MLQPRGRHRRRSPRATSLNPGAARHWRKQDPCTRRKRGWRVHRLLRVSSCRGCVADRCVPVRAGSVRDLCATPVSDLLSLHALPAAHGQWRFRVGETGARFAHRRRRARAHPHVSACRRFSEGLLRQVWWCSLEPRSPGSGGEVGTARRYRRRSRYSALGTPVHDVRGNLGADPGRRIAALPGTPHALASDRRSLQPRRAPCSKAPRSRSTEPRG